MKYIAASLLLLVSGPIWFYLIYQILVRVHASELMFFLFWVYVPASVLAHVIGKISENELS